MAKKEDTLAWLTEAGVKYQLAEHPAAYDMQDIAAFGVDKQGHVAKNLFLRDSNKGRRHFLVTVRGDKQVDLQGLGKALGQRLSFASEQRLEKYLGLHKGEVTPLAARHDMENAVEVVLDKDLATVGPIGVHPCDNTATVFLAFDDLVALVEKTGHKVNLLTL